MPTVLIPDLITIINQYKTSMIVCEVNQTILQIDRRSFQADDIYCHNIDNNNQHFWDTNHNVFVIRYKNIKINPINLDYITYRNLGFQWSYFCNNCGEFLKLSKQKGFTYYCNCYEYV